MITLATNPCGRQPLGADDYFNAVRKGDMFFSQLVGPTLGRVAILDARGRSPHVRSGRPPIVGPRGRGSLPRLPAAGEADTGAFLGQARSPFKCPPAGIRDPDTADRNRLAGLALCSCKPGADEVGKHWARKAVDVHDCFGGTERIAGKQSERSALFAAEMTFSRGCRHSCLPS